MGPKDWKLPVVCLGVSFLAVSTARAEPEGGTAAKIAVAPLEIEGELTDEATTKLEQELLAGLERAGVTVVPPSEVTTGDATLPCGERAGCIVKVARANEASHVLQVKVIKSGRDYSLEMMLSSGSDGSTQAKSNQDCEICGLQELGELIGDQAAAFQPKLEAIPATLIVETSPSGATVRVDGRIVGVSPIVEAVEAGEHTITVAKPGYLDRERKITFVAGGEETVELGLQVAPEAVVEAPPPPDGKGMRVAGWTLLGTGLGLVGGGVPLLILDESPVKSRCDDPANIDVNGLCRFRHNTLGAGIGLAAGGGAALIAGAVLVGLGYKRKKQGKAAPKAEQARVWPTANGIAIRF